ncbi:serine hydrolase domain-containing protein [Sphingomicrobium marinum]|uniref:serine hydrolase domain-containing protein n=1 Tax=Sphingomicrobium marinum TaxID=1227950 RepID=UPI0022402581|nr:serine hydrolase domain-containing protein [Sphingomicrobium marinum]
MAPPQVAVSFDATSIDAVSQGIADPASRREVSAQDPVRIASISKLVVAIGAMQLVEQGLFDLDEPVGKVLGYEVRHPADGDPVTLRMLLSHTSGLRDDAGYALPLGARLQDKLGESGVWGEEQPGYFSYANLNTVVVASMMESVTGERFDRLMARLVFDPLGIDACYNWPGCSNDAVARAVVLQREGEPVWDDLGGKRPACPIVVKDREACDLDRWRAGENGALFSPQGGLRISAVDLATIGRVLLGRGTSNGVMILTPDSVAQMTAPAWTWDGSNGDTWGGVFCRHGLGIHILQTKREGCADDPGLPPGAWFGHSGDAYGLRSGLWLDSDSGRGIAFHAGGEPELLPDEISWDEGFYPIEKEMTARALSLLP